MTKTLKQTLSINLANLFLERHILVPEKTFNTIIECVLKTNETWLTQKYQFEDMYTLMYTNRKLILDELLEELNQQ